MVVNLKKESLIENISCHSGSEGDKSDGSDVEYDKYPDLVRRRLMHEKTRALSHIPYLMT